MFTAGGPIVEAGMWHCAMRWMTCVLVEAVPALSSSSSLFSYSLYTHRQNVIKLCKTLCGNIRELSHKALPLTASARVGLKLHGHIAWSGSECWRLVWWKCVNYVGVEVSFWVSFVWKCGKTEELSGMKGRRCDSEAPKALWLSLHLKSGALHALLYDSHRQINSICTSLMHVETYVAMLKMNSSAMWQWIAGAQSSFFGVATARSRRHQAKTWDFFMCQMWCSSSSAALSQNRDLSFIFWSKLMLRSITAFKVSSCKLLKLKSKGAPSHFKFSFFKQTSAWVASLLSRRWINTSRGVCRHLKEQTGDTTCFSRRVCSSVSAHQPLLFTAHFSVGECYYFLVFTAQLFAHVV